MRYEKERSLIISVCKLMEKLGYFIGTWGNVSMRKNNHILLTPSRIDYNSMKPEDIVIIDYKGEVVEGTRNPTSEKEVHRKIYIERDDIYAIIHAHTPKAMAVSSLNIEEVPCLVEEMSQLLGGSIPFTKEYVPAQLHEELGNAAAKVIGEKNGVILRNHGSVACGKNMEEAILAIKVIEKSCQIYLDIREGYNCEIQTIPDNYIASERNRFLYTYGMEN